MAKNTKKFFSLLKQMPLFSFSKMKNLRSIFRAKIVNYNYYLQEKGYLKAKNLSQSFMNALCRMNRLR